jgi:ATP-dependent Lhr-like helicase
MSNVEPLAAFHPAVVQWFRQRFEAPTPAQNEAWTRIREREHTLIAAPTGSGKTLAAFLASIDELLREGLREGELPDETRVVYISPLKALSADIERNLQEPLAGAAAACEELGLPPVEIRVALRTGDTPQHRRQAMVKRPPHILVTTPESLYILVTSKRGREMLSTTRTVIVDEIHALAGGRRGSHLSLTLERLQQLCDRPIVRIGLSATQRPIERVSEFLVGERDERRHIVDFGHRQRLDLAMEVPRAPLEAVMSNEVWEEIYDRLAVLVREHATTLIFVNTRRLAERATKHLAERLGNDAVAAHHGSLARRQRHDAELRLKDGGLSCLVATASLELGIDIGSVDLVCQLGSTRTISTFLQRVGRSRHQVGATPKGRLFPLSRDELVEGAALLRAVERGELDQLEVPPAPLDILAQQIVASTAAREEWREDELFAMVRRASPYRELSRERFDAVVDILARGYSTHRGRRAAHLHRDSVGRRLRPRRGARLAAITSGGAIPENADYQVLLEPHGTRIGSINEDFAIESIPGDIFQLGNRSWQILRIESGKVRVADAAGAPPTLPFWLGEAPSRSRELSEAVSQLREDVNQILAAHPDSHEEGCDRLVEELTRHGGISLGAAEQLADYLGSARLALGTLPTSDTLVLERFFDEAGGMQLVVHAPFGSRINRAWGLALRKRFCRSFNFELQAAALEDAIVLSLGPTHSFPLAEVFDFLHSKTVRDILVQALLDAPMFATRWRWNTTRALAVLRFRSGKRVPPPLQRMQAEDLLATVFPDQLACLENIAGDREIPDDPLVYQTIEDCLHEVMDVDGLVELIADIEAGNKTLVARDLREPSPLAAEILNAGPYAFLDGAPLEERRTQAVYQRRFLSPEDARQLGHFDPEAIRRVREDAWPLVRDLDELHDALVTTGYFTGEELRAAGWTELFEALIHRGRATRLRISPERWLAVSADRLHECLASTREATAEPPLNLPERLATDWEEHGARVELIRTRLQLTGPVLASQIALELGLGLRDVDAALLELEAKGIVMRGNWEASTTDANSPDSAPDTEESTQWCDRALLARIHRLTIDRLRRQIEPATRAELMRFLLRWQRADPETGAEGDEGLAATLALLEGYEAPARSWEDELLPLRVRGYRPRMVDDLCLSGRMRWTRLERGHGQNRPVATTAITFLTRSGEAPFSRLVGTADEQEQGPGADAQRLLHTLSTRGAAFIDDLRHDTGLLPAQLEAALSELVAAGEVRSDGFAGLRALLLPAERRKQASGRRGRRGPIGTSLERSGRWSLIGRAKAAEEDGLRRRSAFDSASGDEDLQTLAWIYLRRWGVVFRKILERERRSPPWRELLRCYRRLEARGEIRGGRFVSGFSGEQFALPEAVGMLRKVRKSDDDESITVVSGADPLNLTGIVFPEPRVASLNANRVALIGGEPVAAYVKGEVQHFRELEGPLAWEVHTALLRKKMRGLGRNPRRASDEQATSPAKLSSSKPGDERPL